MKQMSYRSLIRRVALVALVLGGVLLVGVMPAAAEEPAPLTFAFRRLQSAAKVQEDNLAQAADLAAKAQEWIDAAAGRGQDVTALQAALDGFEAALAKAQGYHDQAEAVLDAHAGFGDDGQVTDRAAALQTVRSAVRSLRDARLAMREGIVALRSAVRDWRRARRPQQPSGW